MLILAEHCIKHFLRQKSTHFVIVSVVIRDSYS